MGREIRRVPPNWEHPINENGHLTPLFDTYIGDVDVEEWEAEMEIPFDAESRSCYREREWAAEEATAFQVYENVTEGTPISPVFQTKEEMRIWLLAQGHSEKDVDKFIEQGWAMSMVVIRSSKGTEIKMGIDSVNL